MPRATRRLGPAKTFFEAFDLQLEFWLESTFRQQRHQIELINDLIANGRLSDPKPDVNGIAGKKFHQIDLRPVEIEIRRGLFTYFIESLDVFDAARGMQETTIWKEPGLKTSRRCSRSAPPIGST